MLTKRALADLLQALSLDLRASGIFPQKVTLFGSYANGAVHAYSDVDVAVWSEHFSGDSWLDFEKVLLVARKYPRVQLKLYPAGADGQNFDPFIEEIERTGIVIS